MMTRLFASALLVVGLPQAALEPRPAHRRYLADGQCRPIDTR